MAVEDREIVQGVAGGDADAFAALYDRFSGRAYSLLVMILSDKEEAEDALQEAFFDVWRLAERYDPSLASVKAWIMMIVRSRGIDRLRARQRRRERTDWSGEGERTPAGEPSRTEEDLHEVNSVLRDLAPEQRSAIWMAYCRGMTRQQIAAEEGVPVGTIKSRIRSGVSTLKDRVTSERAGSL